MHALIRNGIVLGKHDFGGDTPPNIAANKGRWVAVVDDDAPEEPQYYDRVETVDAGEAVRLSWQMKGVEAIKALRAQELVVFRYQVETGGVAIDGTVYPTDRDTQVAFLRANGAIVTGMTEIQWSRGAGMGWETLSASAFLARAAAVAAHVQGAFARQRVHEEALFALSTPEEVVAYDITTGWWSS